MNPEEFDRILLREEEIEPAAGFLHSVMTAVRNENDVPPRLRFPWVCILPQLVVWCVALAWVVIDTTQLPDRMTRFSTFLGAWSDSIAPILMKADAIGAGWVLLALSSTLLCLQLTRRLAGRIT